MNKWFPTNLSVKVENPGGRPRFHIQAFKTDNGFVFDRRFGWGALRKAPYEQLLAEFREVMCVVKAQFDMGELELYTEFGVSRSLPVDAAAKSLLAEEATRLQNEMFQRMRILMQMVQPTDVPMRTW